MSWIVYALTEPDTGAQRYIGSTKLSVRVRFAQHLGPASYYRNPKSMWISALLAAGSEPGMVVLETLETEHTRGRSDSREAFWIATALRAGAVLLNDRNITRARAVYDLGDHGLSPVGRVLMRRLDRLGLTIADAARASGVSACVLATSMSGRYLPDARGRTAIEFWSEGEITALSWGLSPPKGGFYSQSPEGQAITLAGLRRRPVPSTLAA